MNTAGRSISRTLELLPGEVAQQVLGQQNADDVVLVLADHREARVPGFDDLRQELLGRLVDVDHVHLRARHHDVARLQLGDLQHALDHGERIGVHQVALVGRAQQLDQLLAVLRLAHQDRADALEQGRFRVRVHLSRAALVKSRPPRGGPAQLPVQVGAHADSPRRTRLSSTGSEPRRDQHTPAR